MKAEKFDEFASNYAVECNRALTITGESSEFYAAGRISWVEKALRRIGETKPRRILDFGCGMGASAPLFEKYFDVESYVGVDVSNPSLSLAEKSFGKSGRTFRNINDYKLVGEVDLAYCNGVFHHIPPSERPSPLKCVMEALRPGGVFAFWENNPWNPGTRYVMANCVFDGDAETISSGAAAQLLREAGFQVLFTDFLFVFPKAFSFLRPLEARISKLPIGAQYLVLGRKPE
ncbi:MAG: trans-aconitate 2-methyltransferase [Candidatus Angelobacter sp.]|jgi:trans-aconitate methyltransferase|nr:trans-aconitate 2-methyltransferase [Candidatus Angelobacter sp.]